MADRDISISAVAREPVSQYALDTGHRTATTEARREVDGKIDQEGRNG